MFADDVTILVAIVYSVDVRRLPTYIGCLSNGGPHEAQYRDTYRSKSASKQYMCKNSTEMASAFMSILHFLNL